VTDIFEEVDESLRKDTAAQVWQRIWPWLLGAIVLSVAGVGIYEFMRTERAREIDQQAQVYDSGMAALQKSDFSAARTTFTQLAQGEGGFSTLANHMLAGVENEAGGDKAAQEAYFKAAAAKDKGLMGDLATLKLAYKKADAVTLADLEAITKPLIAKGGQTGALARELVAAKALAGGDIERARTEYQSLSLEIDAPTQMKTRVQQILGTLPAKAAAATPAAAAPATAPAATQPAATQPATPAPAKPAPAQQ
jgi:hypothetical protein